MGFGVWGVWGFGGLGVWGFGGFGGLGVWGFGGLGVWGFGGLGFGVRQGLGLVLLGVAMVVVVPWPNKWDSEPVLGWGDVSRAASLQALGLGQELNGGKLVSEFRAS